MPFSGSWLIFALGSAFFAALTAIFGKLGVAVIPSNYAVLLRTVVILAVTALIVTVRREWLPLGKVPPFTILMLLLSGLATGFSWLCYYRALQMAPASRVAPIDKLSVALVILLSVVFLGEKLTLQTAIGGALILVGAIVLAL